LTTVMSESTPVLSRNDVDNIFMVKSNGTIIILHATKFKLLCRKAQQLQVPMHLTSFSIDKILQRLYSPCLYKEENKLKNIQDLPTSERAKTLSNSKIVLHVEFLQTCILEISSVLKIVVFCVLFCKHL
jgi:hypothetical protein